jgi:hypothetical protein
MEFNENLQHLLGITDEEPHVVKEMQKIVKGFDYKNLSTIN